MNGHVGTKADGYEGVHGEKGYGERNTEGEMLLEFADAMKLVVLNTWFTKNEPKKVTYESGGNNTVVDYMLVRKCDLAKVTDINVIGSEECVKQHKLSVCKIELKECVKKRKKKFEGRHRVWRLRDTDIRRNFAERVKEREERRERGDLESMWKGLKDCLLEETETLCGKTKGRARHKITWWWNKDTELAVKEKRRAYELWKISGLEVDKEAYKKAKCRSRRVVAKAQDEERQRYCDKLVEEDGKGNVFRVAKQMVGLNKNITASGCVKGVDGRTIVEEGGIMQRWKEYYDQLLNEEFDWNKDSIGSSDEMNKVVTPVDERVISVDEVRLAIAKAKSGKAAGPSGVAVDMLKAAGEAGVRWVTDICNEVVSGGVVPLDWKRSWMVNVYKGKGNALECSSYRGIKLLEHVLKVLERVLEARIRKMVKIDEMQFGFSPGKGTTDAIFIVRQVQEKFLGKQKELWMAFVDLEKAFNRVPREVLWWALRYVGVEEWIVNVIKSMYDGITTSVKMNDEESETFEVKVGLHQGSVLSPILFNIVMKDIADNFNKGLPWELLYADDLVLLAESRVELERRLEVWMARLKGKGLRVNIGKTKVMICKVGVGQVENSGKFPCGICRKGVGVNSIRCTSCRMWIHKRCSGVRGRLERVEGFMCRNCCGGGGKAVEETKQFVLGTSDKLEVVEKICYLGDVIGKGAVRMSHPELE